VVITPETVVDWQRRRFRRYWTRISQRHPRSGRPPVAAEIRNLVRQMVRENQWGAPRICSELQKLGFVLSESTLSRYVRRARERHPAPAVLQRWIGTLRREVLDHVVVLSRHHLVQLVNAYIRYYHEDRCHLGLARDTPDGRPVTPRPQTVIDWLVSLTLWPIVTVAWLVTVPFVLLYVAVGFALEILFGILLQRRDDSDGPDPPG